MSITTVKPLSIDSIFASVPRRIINHRCGADWWSEEWGGNSMNAYVERGGIVFYRQVFSIHKTMKFRFEEGSL